MPHFAFQGQTLDEKVFGTGANVPVELNENRVKTELLQFASRSLGRMRHSHQTLAPFAPGIGGEGLGMSDRLVDRQ